MKTPTLPSLAGAPCLADLRLAKIFAAITHAGGKARVVGGAVRDAVLGRKPGDVDVATTLLPDAVMAAAKNAGIRAVPTGFEHGTVTLVVEGHPTEVTTLRRDVRTDGRRAVVAFTEDWTVDAMRRDFTINALYADLDGTLYDPADGYADLIGRRVRFIGEPDLRIHEDRLRILRFFRFHAEIGQGELDRAGLAACARAAGQMAKLSAERVRHEMFRLLAAPGVVAAAGAMSEAGVLAGIGLAAVDIGRLQRLVTIEEKLHRLGDGFLRFAALVLGPVEDAKTLSVKFRLSNRERDRLCRLEAECEAVQATISPAALRAIAYRLGKAHLKDIVLLAWASERTVASQGRWAEIWRQVERFDPPDFPLSGRDLVALGAEPGPDVGAALGALEAEWIAGGFAAGRDELLRKFKARKQ